MSESPAIGLLLNRLVLCAIATQTTRGGPVEDRVINEDCERIEAQILTQVAEKDAELLALRAAHAQLREEHETLKQENRRVSPCRDGHVWLNDYGDDWSPEKGTPCACRAKAWGIPSITYKDVRSALAASPPHPETEGP